MMTAVDSPKAKTLFNLITTKSSNLKQPFKTLDGVLPSPLSREIPKSKLVQKGAKIQRRDIPFQETVVSLTNAKENEYVRPSVDSNSDAVDKSLLPSTQVKVSGIIKPFVKPNETEAERAERIHRSFERLLTFVEIVGQVDNYVSSKWKNLVRTVSNFYDVEDEPYHNFSFLMGVEQRTIILSKNKSGTREKGRIADMIVREVEVTAVRTNIPGRNGTTKPIDVYEKPEEGEEGMRPGEWYSVERPRRAILQFLYCLSLLLFSFLKFYIFC